MLVNTSCGVCVYHYNKSQKESKAVNQISPNVNACAVRLPCKLQPVIPNNNNNNSKKDVNPEIKVASINDIKYNI